MTNPRRNPAHIAAVRRLPCVICGAPATAHHVRQYGEKKDDRRVFPLCGRHHQTGGHGVAIHAGRETWQERYGSEAGHVRQTYEALGVEPDGETREWLERWG